jgi:hypothetical protein
VVRVRENYHSGLLIRNDNKMNGGLISEAAGRKTLRIVDFSPPVLAPFEPSGWCFGWVKVLRLTAFVVHKLVHKLVHDLNQALSDGAESGSLELRIDRR